MKDPSNVIRQWLYDNLQGITYNGAVPVYSFPPKDASMPYIVIGDLLSSGEESTKDTYLTSHDYTIEVWTSFSGNNASYVMADNISNQITQKLRTGPELVFSGSNPLPAFGEFKCIRVEIRGLMSDRFMMDNNIIIYKSLSVNFLMEEL
jgi:hypothetical protein